MLKKKVKSERNFSLESSRRTMLQGMLLRKKNANDQPDPKHELTLEFRKILALFIIGNKTIAILF